MNSDPEKTLIPARAHPQSTLPRLRFPFICLLVFWVATFAVQQVDKQYFQAFFFSLGSSGLFTILFLGWWFFNKALTRRDKLTGFLFLLVEAILVGKTADKTVNFITLWSVGFPLVATVVVLVFFLAKKYPIRIRPVFAICTTITWSLFLLFRTNGVDSTLKADLHWRWTPTAEQIFLSQNKGNGTHPVQFSASSHTARSPLDWPEFRGTNRDGVIHGSAIATNWTSNPPALVWKKKVGPGWSSMSIVKGNLFTQEQRGEKEVTVCYDASSGQQIWVHEETARFEEPVSGPGPRATPTWSNDRIYSLGGTGILTCLNATNGQAFWVADIKKDSGAPTPIWAFSSSPLILGNKAIVYAGGTQGKSILAYDINTGKVVWSAAGGASSYSSAQAATIDGVQQCLMLHDGGLTSLDPTTGKVIWEMGSGWKGAPRCGQPQVVDGDSLVVGSLDGPGTTRLKVSKSGEKCSVAPTWVTKDLKPEFPDFVVSGNYAYGFDVSMFTCINLKDGKRAWKEGRYGRGQVVLLADQQLLLITSETGELALLGVDPVQHQELGRFQAIEGKTWAHAVVQGDKIFLRNSEEMACYVSKNK
ncbi:MAG: repeat-like protein [Verrucomicrobiales bacterium]|nr:repeat-like protein [Verrucomicrobiales bacterium]